MRRRAVALAGTLVLVTGAWWGWQRARMPDPGAVPREPAAIVPEGVRIRVEVVNASDVRGLARRATLHLRDLGFDVVRYSGSDTRRDSSLVIDRTGHPDWARMASRAMGGAPVESRPDSSRFVDLTILLGATWRPPAQPFHP